MIVPVVSTSSDRGGSGAGGCTVTRNRPPSWVTSMAPESTRSSMPSASRGVPGDARAERQPPDASKRNSPSWSTLTPGSDGTGGGWYWKLWL